MNWGRKNLWGPFLSNYSSALPPTFARYFPETLSASAHPAFEENLQAAGRLRLRKRATTGWLRATEDMELKAVQEAGDGSVEKVET